MDGCPGHRHQDREDDDHRRDLRSQPGPEHDGGGIQEESEEGEPYEGDGNRGGGRKRGGEAQPGQKEHPGRDHHPASRDRAIVNMSCPSQSVAKSRDVRRVVLAVPGVHREHPVEAKRLLLLRMEEGAAPLLLGSWTRSRVTQRRCSASSITRETPIRVPSVSGSSAHSASSYGLMVGLSSVSASLKRM